MLEQNPLVPMLERLVEKVSRMRPIPPCKDLFDKDWDKVDKLILKTMKAMKERDVEKPLHPLSETLFDMAIDDVVKNGRQTNEALQAVTFRVMDTRILVDEFGRMRTMAVAIRDAARDPEVKVPSPHFKPENPIMIPPCFYDRDVYNDSAMGIVARFAEVLRDRNILPQKKEE